MSDPMLCSIFPVPFRRGFLTLAVLSILLFSSIAAACSPPAQSTEPSPEPIETASEITETGAERPASRVELESSAFEAGGSIPERFTCDGEGISPPLSWEDDLSGVASFAIIMEDPDAPGGTWTHWVLYNLPAEVRSLEAASGARSRLPAGAQVGTNSWGETDYGGPCPPSGTHRYFFYLFALDSNLDLEAGATSEELREAIRDHTLARSELMGTFSQ